MSAPRHARGCTCSTNCKAVARLEGLGQKTREDRVAAIDGIGRLLEFAVDFDETPEEAEAELVAQGVDVPAFLERVHKAIEEAKEPVLVVVTRAQYLKRRANGGR